MRRLARQHGQTAAEYLGVLLVVSTIIAALATAAPGEAIKGAIENAICRIAGSEGCGTQTPPPVREGTRGDRDGDGISDADERRAGLDAGSADTDGDGIDDRRELEQRTNPLSDDTDNDGIPDRQEADSGGKLDPTKADTDGDGLTDGEEAAIGTDPSSKDSDGFDTIGDGLTDAEELARGTDPNNHDSDGDGNPDGYEVRNGDDPTSDERSLLTKGFETFVLDDPLSLLLPTGAAAKYLGKGLALKAKSAYKALREAKTLEQANKARRDLLAVFRERLRTAPKDDPAAAARQKALLDDLAKKELQPKRVDPWSLDPKLRGVEIEKEIAEKQYRLEDGWWNVGATKGGNSPLIDFQRHDVALSLKTVDTRLTYAGNDLFKHIRALSERSITIDGNPATKVLDIRVPVGQGGAPLLRRLEAYGRARGVRVQSSEYP